MGFRMVEEAQLAPWSRLLCALLVGLCVMLTALGWWSGRPAAPVAAGLKAC